NARLAGEVVEVLVAALVTTPHLIVERNAPRDDAAAGAPAFLPIVHVALLEGSRRAEAAHAGHPDRLLDVRRGGLIGKDPGPDLRLVGPTRMPHAEAARGRAQHREVREHRADNGIDQLFPGAEP